MTVGPQFAAPLARQLYAEIAAIEEQHVTQYESIIDPKETWLEKWLLHEATEIYNYMGWQQYEGNSRVKSIWDRLRTRTAPFRNEPFKQIEKGTKFVEQEEPDSVSAGRRLRPNKWRRSPTSAGRRGERF
jgi:hypothetical protein